MAKTDTSRCAAVKKELKPSNFLLTHSHPNRFVQFVCGRPHLYVAWRCFWFLYHLAVIIFSGISFSITNTESIKWFIFLTNWSYVILTLTSLIEFIITLYVHLRKPSWLSSETDKQMPISLKIFWVFFNISNTSAIIVSVMYWALVYNSTTVLSGLRFRSILTHAFNTGYVLVNLFLTGAPVRAFHFYQPMGFGLLYVLFTLFYHLAGGIGENGVHYIYATLDWRKPGLAVGVGVTTIAVAGVVHLIVFALYLLRETVAARCCRRRRDSEDPV